MPRHPSFVPTYHSTPYSHISPLNPSLSLVSKTAIIAGATRGIGRAIAHSFAEAGANVFLLGRSESDLRSAVASIASSYPSVGVDSAPADVTSPTAVRAALDKARARFGTLDVLVCNAGYLDAHVRVAEAALDDYWTCFEVNVKGVVVVVKEWLRDVCEAATFINISSGAAHIDCGPGFSAYSSSKIAMARVVEYLHDEQNGVRVFNVQPGAIATDMQRKAPEIEAADDITLPGAFCVWLVSPEAEFLRGRFVWANWDVDELIARKDAIETGGLLKMGLKGWPVES